MRRIILVIILLLGTILAETQPVDAASGAVVIDSVVPGGSNTLNINGRVLMSSDTTPDYVEPEEQVCGQRHYSPYRYIGYGEYLYGLLYYSSYKGWDIGFVNVTKLGEEMSFSLRINTNYYDMTKANRMTLTLKDIYQYYEYYCRPSGTGYVQVGQIGPVLDTASITFGCTDEDNDGICADQDCDGDTINNPSNICCADDDGDGVCAEDDCDGDTAYNPENNCCPEIFPEDIRLKVAVNADNTFDVDVIEKPEGTTVTDISIEGGSSDKVVKKGTNKVKITLERDGCDPVTVPKNVNFVDSNDGNCGLIVDFGSSAQVATGELLQSFNLFSVDSSVFALRYNSFDGNDGSLGLNWTHNYNIYLSEDDFNTVALHDGNGIWKLYTPSGYGYASQPGDYNVLSKGSSGQLVLTKPNGTVYTFGANNKIASIVDRNGNALTFTYSGDGLIEITDNNGRTILFNTFGGILSSVTDPAGNMYSFSVSDALNSITYPDGSSWQFSYQDNAYMTSKVDPAGNLTSYYYDDQNRVIEAVDPQGRSRSIDYPDPGEDVRTTAFTEKDGSVWLYTYSVVSGDLVSKTDPQGNVTSYQYDVDHNLVAKNEPGVGTSYFAYDSNGNMVASTDAAGNTTGYTYNSFGQITSVTNAAEETTVYEYNEQGNLIEVTDPQGNSRIYQYDEQGRLIRTTSPTGETTQLTYDNQGNVGSVTGPDGQITTFTYDANGNRLSMTDHLGNTTQYEYDAKGQLIKVIDAQGNVTLYTYDANGNRSSVTDAKGKTTTFTYTFEGQMISMTDAMGFVTEFEYSGSAGCSTCSGGVDKRTALIDAKGQTTNFQYDSMGNLIKEVDPLGQKTEYLYDAAGRVASKSDPNGNTINYSYDALGRLTAKTYPDGSQTTFSYDVKGNLTAAANRHIAYAFAYDANDQLIGVSDSFGHVLNYSYDASGNRTGLNSSESINIIYRYDEAGRLDTIQSDQTSIAFGYDDLGRRNELVFPNGVTTSYQYDDLGRLTDLMTASWTSIIAQNHYTHDAVGNRMSNRDTLDTTSYVYDDIYRLTEAVSNTPGDSVVNDKKDKTDFNATDLQKEFYQYDQVGNRIASSEHSSYQHNSGNQLLLASSIQYQYDANGNRTARVSPEGITTYTWGFENQLIKVATPEGSLISYAYDPFGRRIAKTINGSTIRYTYDSEDILFEAVDGSIGNIYIHGPSIDEPLALLGKKGATYYHADGLGSIVAMTDDQARNVQQYEYDSFGNQHDMKNRIKQPYGYTGREHDRETGLRYYRARYYDGEVGRFISEDPIGFAGGDVNLYAYVWNAPIYYIDPLGLWGDPFDTLFTGEGADGLLLDALGDLQQTQSVNHNKAQITKAYTDIHDKKAENWNAAGHAINAAFPPSGDTAGLISGAAGAYCSFREWENESMSNYYEKQADYYTVKSNEAKEVLDKYYLLQPGAPY